MPRTEPANLRVEQVRVTAHQRRPGAQHILEFLAPEIAARARPGQFVHIECGPECLLRRPMSILSAQGDKIEILFKQVGHGTGWLAARKVGDSLSLIGPIGNTFQPDTDRPLHLLLGGGVGLPPILFFAEWLHRHGAMPAWVIAGSEVPFPLATRTAHLPLPGMESPRMHSLVRLERSGVANRLASLAGLPGCFTGQVTEPAENLILALDPRDRNRLSLYACGPTPMLRATAALAARYKLPCQLSLEEYMACGIGGCAGCTVKIATATGPAMKRVCVDGPIFEAAEVFPPGPREEERPGSELD